ncbi:hypothetical protein TIFTF001_038337 [Ficus carica]|uniref:Uncharacterized protein n=1 Tax=Ficus carica TaxID=3494 RepID=A0AA88EBB6_FICCA|nr:hypothetical protein TIFTF001_038337 [Ficus carica]
MAPSIFSLCVIVWVEKLIGFVVGEGDWSTVPPVNFRDVLSHVYIFSPINLLGLTGITFPVTHGVTSGSPSKDGVDNVLGLRGIRLVAVLDQQFNLVPQLYAILRLVADIFVKIAILVLVPPGTVSSQQRWIPQYPPARNLIQDMLNGSDQWGILAEPPRWHFWSWGRVSPTDTYANSLLLLWSDLRASWQSPLGARRLVGPHRRLSKTSLLSLTHSRKACTRSPSSGSSRPVTLSRRRTPVV